MEIRNSLNFSWNIKDVLGQGATGAVYKGRDKRTGIEVAIKVTNHLGMMRPLEVRKREFEVLNRLDHENIVKIFASESELRSQSEIIAMELCTGGSLFTLLEHPSNSFGFSERDCKDIIRDVVAGMEHLRKQGIVHRDLKPGNIMRVFNDDGTCCYKLTDFGAARELEHSAEQFMSVYGTEEYLHPDLYERGVLRKSSGKTFGANVDLWSIGVTFYHIATGKLPFRPQGGRKNKDTMYHITTAKATGMISGTQRSMDGKIEWSDKLPDHTNLSRGFQNLLVPILAGVLESDPSKMMSFDEFFGRVQDMVTRKVFTVYHVQTSSFHEIYIPPTAQFEMFQELVSKETGLHSSQQKLFVNGERFMPSHAVKAENFPPTSRTNPMILMGGDMVRPDALTMRKIPSVTGMTDEWTLEADSAAAKIRANCAYACKFSTQYYGEIIDAMCLSFIAIVKSFKHELLQASVDCGEMFGRRTIASHMTNVICNGQEHFMALLEGLISSVPILQEEKTAIENELTQIKQIIQNKRQSNQELEKNRDFIEKLKVLKCDVVDNDNYASSIFLFNQQAKEKTFLPLVSNLTTKIQDIYNRYRKEKHARRLSTVDERNHKYDRKRLVKLTDQLIHATREAFNHAVKMHSNLVKLFQEVNIYRSEAYRLKDQLLRIASSDEAHVAALEAFQSECQERYQSIIDKLCQCLKTKHSTAVGTDIPSLGQPSNGEALDEFSEKLIQEMETQMKSMYETSEINTKTAKDNSIQLKVLTESFTEFYQLLAESGARTLNDLKVLQDERVLSDEDIPQE